MDYVVGWNVVGRELGTRRARREEGYEDRFEDAEREEEVGL